MVAGIPGVETSGPEGQRAEPAGDTPPSVAHKRSTLKAMLPALALAVIGLALLAGAYILYPRASELPTPPYSTLAVSAAFPIFGLTYAAEPKSSSTTIVTVSVALAAGTTSAHAVHLGVQMPFGTVFWDCTGRTCKPRGKPIQGAWGQADRKSTR